MQYADFLVAPSNSTVFTNTREGDLIIRALESSQKIHLGVASNQQSQLEVSSNAIAIKGDLFLTNGTIYKDGQPFVSGGGGSVAGFSNTSNAVYVLPGLNFGIGTSNTQARLHVDGDTFLNGNVSFANRLVNFTRLRLNQAKASTEPANVTSVITEIPGVDVKNPSVFTFSLSNQQQSYSFKDSNNSNLASISSGETVVRRRLRILY